MKKTLALALSLTLLLTACGAPGGGQTEDTLLRYDLGEGLLEEADGRSVSYSIQGVLGIPEEKDCPVVVLLHGAHPIENAAADRYDIGFEYLVDALSQQGNLVISMNVGMNFSFENGEPTGNERTRQIFAQQMALLQKAVAGDDSVFGRSLSDLGDFSRVILVGHSRSGLDVVELAADAPEGMDVAGVVAVAPSMYKELETEIPNVPLGILLAQMDGDVISLDGNDIFERAVAQASYRGTAELIYLKNANHGAFNTQLTEPDMNHSEEDLAQLMEPETQRGFLVNYLMDFVRSAASAGESPLASAPELQSRLYDCDVLVRLHCGAQTLLYSADETTTLSCEESTAAVREIASYLPAVNTVGPFRMPGGAAFAHYGLQHISWSGPEGSVTVPISGDLSGCRFLNIDMAVDSTDPLNRSGQTMQVSLADEAGGTAQITVDASAAALLWQEGTLSSPIGWDGLPHEEYSTFTPLVTLRIPLEQLQTVDLSQLDAVKLSFPQSPGGSIMLRSISGCF